MKELKNIHKNQKKEIDERLNEFKLKNEEEQYRELLFCILTPQSNAKTCWQAIEIISKSKPKNEKEIQAILRGKTRFHKTKAKRIILAKESWKELKKYLNLPAISARDKAWELINGYGLKEASHFIRNIGKSNNQLAILDRHILKQMKKHQIIEDIKIKNNKHYKELEKTYLDWAKKIEIPADELDLVLWYQTHKEIFK